MRAPRAICASTDAALRRGDWQSHWAVSTAPPPLWPELAGRTIGILGFGRIGQNIARRARAFEKQVCAIRRDVGQSMEDDLALLGGPKILDRVLERSDYVVVSMPASPQTVGWIGEPQLRRMKPSAYLINVARGEIVDEDALYHALARRTIAGAALDVWYRYPREPGATAPATRPFQELPNVLMTPHVSGYTDGTLDARAKLIAENIARIAREEPPLGVGLGSVILLPWVQSLIATAGWRLACWSLGIVILVLLAPPNLLLRREPKDIGLVPDGIETTNPGSVPRHNVVDFRWAAIDWTFARVLGTARFLWIALSYFCGTFVWYAVQVHQTNVPD